MPLAGTAALLARLPAPAHLSGDDAMGVGIAFLILAGAATASALLFGIILLANRRSWTEVV
jgi:multidrug transporter EmrE-like cation transporter